METEKVTKEQIIAFKEDIEMNLRCHKDELQEYGTDYDGEFLRVWYKWKLEPYGREPKMRERKIRCNNSLFGFEWKVKSTINSICQHFYEVANSRYYDSEKHCYCWLNEDERPMLYMTAGREPADKDICADGNNPYTRKW